MKTFFGFCLAILLPLQVAAQMVAHRGEARKVMTGIDLSAHVQLDTLAGKPNFYALGPVDNLQGEITAFDGVVFTSTLDEEGKISTCVKPAVKAPFLVYSFVADWIAIEITQPLDGLNSLENLLDSLSQHYNFPQGEAFPFRLSATWEKVAFHVIMRDKKEEKHSHEAHQKAKVPFSAENVAADLLGFFSKKHEGVFTHKGQKIHVHYLKEDRSQTGHLDGLRHTKAFILYLPAALMGEKPSPKKGH